MAEKIQPYVPPDKTLPDFTLKAVLAGVLFGIIFGSANAYLGLRVGLTISTAIPLAVISVALFRALQPILGKATILECNIAQTTGSASSSLASGIIFTIPALFLWGFDPPILQITALAVFGGILGILFMIPLRKFLIVREHENLPYPEGTASAQVLIAADAGGARARNVFLGLGVGAIYKGLVGFLHLWPEKVGIRLPGLKKAVIGIETTPALLGVGYILGYRIAAIMVAGGLLSWVAIIPLIAHFGEHLNLPLFPETAKTIAEMTPREIWTRYIRYIGAGAVAFAGIITVIKSAPTMYQSLKIGLKELLHGAAVTLEEDVRTEKNLPMWFVLVGSLVIILLIIVTPHVLGTEPPLAIRILGAFCIALFAFAFVTVSSRIVGLVGVSSNPTSGMTIVTLLGTSSLFYLLGITGDLGKATALTVGTVVCVAASIAGDISQDLKSGFLIGATPWKQQLTELIGASTSAFFIASAVWLLGEAFQFGSTALPAPQATLMKTVIEGVLAADLPWGLVFAGAALAAVAELLSVPSLPFAVGIYLPLSTMTPVYIGGLLRRYVEIRSGKNDAILQERKEKGVLLGSGLIAGEGIMGVLLALYAFITQRKPEGIGIHWPEGIGDLISLGVFAALGLFLLRMTRTDKSA
jgi:putative OPT family oligopeptide transporter